MSGVSACTFASSVNYRLPEAFILLVENGRRLGGRSTTRQSRNNIILNFDNGLPSINFSKSMSQDLSKLISPLIMSKKLVDITNYILEINEFWEIDNFSTTENIYRSFPYMINFCVSIIHQSVNRKKINFLFKTLIK